MEDKDLDIASIVRESFKDAMKSHGLIKEQKPSEDVSQEDVADHTAFMKVLPKDWLVRGTVPSEEIDAILENLSGGAASGMQRFTNCLNNMSRLLGAKPGKGGLPVETEESSGNLSEIVSALQLRMLINNIVSGHSPQAAGKIFEGLVARMVGGYGPDDEDKLIEDIIDNEGNLISLKLIDKTTKVKGSKYNLANGVLRVYKNDPAKEMLGVRYLICIKDKRNNPFAMKTVSFVVNSKNYFNFICGTANPTLQQIEDARTKILIRKAKKETDIQAEAKNLQEVTWGPASEDFNNAIDNYAKKHGIKQENVRTEIQSLYRQFVTKAEPSGEQEREFYGRYLSSTDKDKDFNFSDLKSAIPLGEGKNILKKNAIFIFKNLYNRIANLEYNEYAPIFEKDPETKNILLNGSDEQKKRILSINRTKYESAFGAVLRKLTPLNTFIEEIENIVAASSTATAQAQKLQAPVSVDTVVKKFFEDLENISGYEKAGSTGKDTTQFMIELEDALSIARESAGSEYSEEYPQIYVDKATLFAGAEANNVLLKEWYTPIYKKFYKVDADLKNFYIKKQLSGLNQASNSTKDLKDEIDIKITKTKEMAVTSPEQIKTSQLQENKQKHLTKHWSEIMLDELLND